MATFSRPLSRRGSLTLSSNMHGMGNNHHEFPFNHLLGPFDNQIDEARCPKVSIGYPLPERGDFGISPGQLSMSSINNIGQFQRFTDIDKVSNPGNTRDLAIPRSPRQEGCDSRSEDSGIQSTNSAWGNRFTQGRCDLSRVTEGPESIYLNMNMTTSDGPKGSSTALGKERKSTTPAQGRQCDPVLSTGRCPEEDGRRTRRRSRSEGRPRSRSSYRRRSRSEGRARSRSSYRRRSRSSERKSSRRRSRSKRRESGRSSSCGRSQQRRPRSMTRRSGQDTSRSCTPMFPPPPMDLINCNRRSPPPRPPPPSMRK